MAVLVTGGAGFIGSHMVLELCDAGEKVVVLDNLTTGFAWAVDKRAELVVGDIGDERLVEHLIAKHRINAIIHFAGSIIVPESVTDPLKYYDNNTNKSRSLIASAVKNGVKHFIFSSTAAVYGMPEVNPVEETARLNPMSPYGTSKLMTEWMLRDISAAHDFSYVALRYFNVAGADPKGRSGQSTPKATHLIKVANQVALGQRPRMQVFGADYETHDGTCVRDFIHVSDLANAHALALKYLREGGKSEVFNCGYGKGYSVLEVLAAVRKAADNDFPIEFLERRAGDPAAIVAKADKIRRILGWQPKYEDLNLIVSQAFAWEARLAHGQTTQAA